MGHSLRVVDDALARFRAICAELPDVNERPSHGAPTWFVRDKRSFAMFMNDHHGDGRLAAWVAAAPGAKEALIASDAARFFNPPYVGTRGWVGVRLEPGVDWEEVAGVVREGYDSVVAKLGGRRAK